MAEAAIREARHIIVDNGDEDDAICRPSSIVDDDGICRPSSDGEIEEMEPAADGQQLATAGGRQDTAPSDADDVYVAVGKGGSSMAALSWALRHLAKPRSFVYLVHVFPVVTTIPTPLGMMPKNQVSPDQVESYMNQQRVKMRQMLHKYQDHCRNFQVNVDVHLIESDQVADAVSQLIPVLAIKQMVLGVSKSNMRKLKKGSTIAGQVQKKAPLYCEVKIVCDGQEVSAATTADPTPPVSPSPANIIGSTPNRGNIAASDNHDDDKPKEKTKIPRFLKCLTF